ncbi:MAG: tetratricopeptide repeat protein, partial [Candidatus Hydrogenedentes bacterium]|nr:tetratricopeptide repeat protein [Candidatus Hydrogenedentota bacterium]
MRKSNRLKRLTAATNLTTALLIACAGLMPVYAQETPAVVIVETSPEPGVSPAEQLYREGVSLYSNEMFREAHNAFSRALAIDPAHENAKKMLQKAEGKIQMVTSGEQPSAIQTFDVFDPETIPSTDDGGVPKSAEDVKFERTKQLITEGEYYLENKKFSRAQKLFEQVLLIDPNNQTATRLLSEATIGAYDEQLHRDWRDREEDRYLIRQNIEETKMLPDGADARGIKEPPLYVPVHEEQYFEERAPTEIEKALDAPVAIEFADQHISKIVEFIADYIGINIVI